MGKDFDKNIAQSVLDLIKKPIRADISPYDENLRDEITDAWFCASCDGEFDSCCEDLVTSRNRLSETEVLDFSDASFLDAALGYLNSVYRLFSMFSVQRDDGWYMADVRPVKKIVEGDVEKNEDGTYSVGLCNPMVLGSLIAVMLQRSDLDAFLDDGERIGCDDAVKKIYIECFRRMTDELFKSIVLVCDGVFCVIVGYDTARNVFIAVREEESDEYEPVSALGLYDRIADAAAGAEKALGVCIVGKTEPGSVDILRKILRRLNVNMDRLDTCGDIDGHVRKSELDDAIASHESVYITGCMEEYLPATASRRGDYHNHHFIGRSGKMRGENLELSDFRDMFYRRNSFADAYYAVQCRYLGSSRYGTVRDREINGAFFDYLVNKSSDFSDIGKSVCVCVSDDADLRSYAEDSSDGIRSDVCSMDGYKILCMGRGLGISGSKELTLEFSYFDILSAISPSYAFYCEMTGVDASGSLSEDDVACAVERAHDTSIALTYGKIYDDMDGLRKIDVEAKVSYPWAEPPEGYASTVEAVVRNVFSLRSAVPSADVDRRIGRDISRSLRSAMTKVFFGHARNFNDMLFGYVFSRRVGLERIGFNVVGVGFASRATGTGKTDVCGGADDQVMRFSRYVAEYLIVELGGRFYPESGMSYQLRLTGSSQSKLDRYVSGIMAACMDLGYTDSVLYQRLGNNS